MEVGKLTVEMRKRRGKGVSRRLRAEGYVPGVCYGAGLEEPVALVVQPRALKASLDPVKGSNTLITMTVMDDGKPAREINAMLWEYQTDPIRRTVVHVDFKAIDPDQVIEVEIPIALTGKAAGAIDGGQITVARHLVPVKCKPADIPDRFVIDVTPLDIGDVFHASDLEMPSGVTLAIAGEQGLVSCIAPEKEEAAPAVAAEEGAAPAEGAEGAAEPKGEGKAEKKEGE
jgi:large subunit ribosomal protein L25